jgi:hypothetical protein
MHHWIQTTHFVAQHIHFTNLQHELKLAKIK